MLRLFVCLTITMLFNIQAFGFETKAKWAVLSDINTGAVLFSKNSDQKMPPSSMTKLMTIYMVFEKLRDGTMKLDDTILVSDKAWKETGSRMFLLPNTMVSIEDLLRGVIVQSGNDASVALAEAVAGSEDAFVERMNAKAQSMGMNNSNFTNSTGLNNPNHYMTTDDLLIISKRLIQDFPEYYNYFAEKEFTYNKIKQPNRNILLFRDIGVDGLKTGHTDAGGYGISVSALKNGRRLIAIVNGCKSESERAAEVQKILQYGFMNFANVNVAKKDQALVSIDVIYGPEKKVDLVTKEDVSVTVPVDSQSKVKSRIKYPSHIYSPASTKDVVGVLEVDLGDGKRLESNLYLVKDIPQSGWFSSLWYKIKHIISNMSFQQIEVKEQYKDLN